MNVLTHIFPVVFTVDCVIAGIVNVRREIHDNYLAKRKQELLDSGRPVDLEAARDIAAEQFRRM
jgi:hypothetical protein